jgi:hypothetical protein
MEYPAHRQNILTSSQLEHMPESFLNPQAAGPHLNHDLAVAVRHMKPQRVNYCLLPLV